MAEEPKLKPGSFYWVIPEFDVDFTPPGFEGRECDQAMYEAMRNHWTQRRQPARFDGYSQNGEEVWHYIGVDKAEAPWPVCWTGAEIVDELDSA